MNVENENHSRRSVNVRIKVGLVYFTTIQLPLILLLLFLVESDLISFFVYYIGLLSVGIGGLCIGLVITDLYVKRKQLNR